MQRDGGLSGGDGEIVFEHGAERDSCLTTDCLANQIGDHGAEEKPPQFQCAIELGERNGLDAIVKVAEMLRGAADSGKSFGSGAAEFRIFENADAKAAKIRLQKSGVGRMGAESASPGSAPAITSNKTRKSATVLAIGPTTPSQLNAPAPGGKWPVAGMRPGVGFNPQIPEKCAGVRMEPPPSLPTPPMEQPEAIAAASPPLEPPAE